MWSSPNHEVALRQGVEIEFHRVINNYSFYTMITINNEYQCLIITMTLCKHRVGIAIFYLFYHEIVLNIGKLLPKTKYRILRFCDKTELYLTVLQQNNVEACSLWLPLALSGSLLLSEFAYNILARLTRPLLSSQRRCCAATLSAALVHS